MTDSNKNYFENQKISMTTILTILALFFGGGGFGIYQKVKFDAVLRNDLDSLIVSVNEIKEIKEKYHENSNELKIIKMQLDNISRDMSRVNSINDVVRKLESSVLDENLEQRVEELERGVAGKSDKVWYRQDMNLLILQLKNMNPDIKIPEIK